MFELLESKVFNYLIFSFKIERCFLFNPNMIQNECENELSNSQNDPLILCQELAVKFRVKDHHENLNGNLNAHKI